MTKDKLKLIGYWITTIMGPFRFVIGGIAHLMHYEQPSNQLAHLGYPVYVLNILGFWKLIGAIITVLPKLPILKEWAYAGFVILLSSAAASHFFAGDPFFAASPAQISSPLFFLVLVLASWALRPKSRRAW